jgi:hypothetical protein
VLFKRENKTKDVLNTITEIEDSQGKLAATHVQNDVIQNAKAGTGIQAIGVRKSWMLKRK